MKTNHSKSDKNIIKPAENAKQTFNDQMQQMQREKTKLEKQMEIENEVITKRRESINAGAKQIVITGLQKSNTSIMKKFTVIGASGGGSSSIEKKREEFNTDRVDMVKKISISPGQPVIKEEDQYNEFSPNERQQPKIDTAKLINVEIDQTDTPAESKPARKDSDNNSLMSIDIEEMIQTHIDRYKEKDEDEYKHSATETTNQNQKTPKEQTEPQKS